MGRFLVLNFFNITFLRLLCTANTSNFPNLCQSWDRPLWSCFRSRGVRFCSCHDPSPNCLQLRELLRLRQADESGLAAPWFHDILAFDPWQILAWVWKRSWRLLGFCVDKCDFWQHPPRHLVTRLAYVRPSQNDGHISGNIFSRWTIYRTQ